MHFRLARCPIRRRGLTTRSSGRRPRGAAELSPFGSVEAH
jgi:hypothetical protein